MIDFHPITAENFEACIALSIREDQRDFVDTVVYSIALTKVETHWQPFAVYDDQVLVGFIMYGKIAPEVYTIDSVTIDQRYQGRGYGRAMMQFAMTRLCALPDCHFLKLTHNPQNEVAARLYASLGFVYIDEYWYDGQEQVMQYVCLK